MPRVTREPLRDLLAQRAERLREETLRSGGEIAAAELDALARLQRLVEIRDATARVNPARRWPLALAFAVTLAITSVLLFVRVRETDVDLELRLSEVSFVLPAPQMLTQTTSVVAAGASGLRAVRLPARDGAIGESAARHDGVSALRMSVTSAHGRPGSIDLAPIAPPAGTRVWLSRRDGSYYRLSFATAPGSALQLRADVNGTIDVGIPGRPPARFEWRSPRGVTLEAGSGRADLDLAFARLPIAPFASPVSLEGLQLSRVEQLVSVGGTLARRVSTVLGGILYFESLGGQERKLRPGELLEFGHSSGELRTVDLREDGIALRFSGRVRDMTVGAPENHRSLMPTWLDWLQARHALSLLWGATVYVFGLLLVVLRWWRMTNA